MTTGAAAGSKSGLKQFKTGEVLFNDGDIASSLFIIQKGQVRLYKPKGKGYIELTVLRAGEVIGEMAYFDEDGSGKKRSCSASAITPVEIIEISFAAFGKTMESLNPWFKTIINTVVTRLRKANGRIRELEDNQASISYSGKHTGYEFMKPIEVMRILGTFFLVFKAHGEAQGSALAVNRKVLNLYTQEMYQIMEVKIESIITLLVNLGWMEIKQDENKLPNILLLNDLVLIRQIFIFYNSERHLPEDKKLRIGEKCEMLISKMLEMVPTNPLVDIPNIKVSEDNPVNYYKYYNLTPVLDFYKAQKVIVHANHVDDAKGIFFGEIFLQDGSVLVEIDFPKMQKLYPVIRFMNAIKKSNTEKAPGGALE